MGKKIRAVLAPTLAVERATSMDIYTANVRAALMAHRDRLDLETVCPASSPRDSRFAKLWQRHVLYPRRLRRRCRELGPAVVHVLDQSYGHLCAADPPTVVTCHGLENLDLPLKIWRQQALWLYRVRGMRRARRVVTVSRTVADHVVERLGIDPARIVVNHNGVHPDYQPLSPTELDRDNDLPFLAPLARARKAGEILVLHVGTNVARKNLDTLLRALAVLRSEKRLVRLIKAGADLHADGFGPLIASLGLEGAVTGLGALSAGELMQVYNRCDVLMFPSLYEGFGLPIIEAQACGLPTVLADTVSAHEIGGDAALYHEPRSHEDLARQVRLALDASTRTWLIEAGRRNSAGFSWAAHARCLADLYEEVYQEVYAVSAPASQPRSV